MFTEAELRNADFLEKEKVRSYQIYFKGFFTCLFAVDLILLLAVAASLVFIR